MDGQQDVLELLETGVAFGRASRSALTLRCAYTYPRPCMYTQCVSQPQQHASDPSHPSSTARAAGHLPFFSAARLSRLTHQRPPLSRFQRAAPATPGDSPFAPMRANFLTLAAPPLEVCDRPWPGHRHDHAAGRAPGLGPCVDAVLCRQSGLTVFKMGFQATSC